MTNADSQILELENFTVSFDGDPGSENVIAVDDLADALLGLSSAFKQTNAVLNGNSASVRLNARAVSPGSFEVDLQLVQEIAANTIHVLSSSLVVSALNLRNILIAGDGVIGVIKRLAGSRPTITRFSDDEAEIRVNGDTFNIHADTVQIFQNSDVRQSLGRFVKPLNGEIDRISVRENNEDIILIDKDEVSHFDFEDYTTADTHPHVTTSITREPLSLVVPRFKPDPRFNLWRLQLGESGTSTYLITDKEFLTGVDRGTKFGKGDILACDVRVTKTVNGMDTKLDYEILKVHEHRDGPVQLSYLDGDQPSGGFLDQSDAVDSS